MKKVVIALFFTIAFVSCVGLKAEKQVGEWKNFFGEWSKNNTEEGEYFILDFRSDNDTLVEISYSVMGPFEEILYGKLISKTKVELYFNYIMGSISFANVTKQNEARLEKCKKKKGVTHGYAFFCAFKWLRNSVFYETFFRCNSL